jgi:hypothetical protein
MLIFVPNVLRTYTWSECAIDTNQGELVLHLYCKPHGNNTLGALGGRIEYQLLERMDGVTIQIPILTRSPMTSNQ